MMHRGNVRVTYHVPERACIVKLNMMPLAHATLIIRHHVFVVCYGPSHQPPRPQTTFTKSKVVFNYELPSRVSILSCVQV
jgi:hypothetical protein